MKKIVFLSAFFFVFIACSNSAGKSDNEVYKDDDAESTETENESDLEDESLSDFDEDIELCGPDLTKKVWESEAWKKGDDDKDGIPNGYECQKCPCEDYDGDNSTDYQDEDSEGDGISDVVECPEYTEENGCRDSDGDEHPDYLDRDSDNDGISDKYEYEQSATDPYSRDTDGDGDDDLTEIVCNETDPLDAEDHSTFPTICSSGCYLGNDVKRELSFNTGPREQTDITFLIDVTNSMEDYMENVKSEIMELIDEKLSEINIDTESLSFGLVEIPYNVVLPQTEDEEAFKTNISTLGFEQKYELHLETIYQSIIGNGFMSRMGVWVSGLGFLDYYDIAFPEKKCEGALGDIGGVCLRDKANHIMVVLSDTEIQEIFTDKDEKQSDHNFYWMRSEGYPSGHDSDEVIAAMIENDAKIIQISPFLTPNDVESSILETTLSKNNEGEVLYFGSLNPENGKLSDDVVTAINSLLEYEKTDLKMELILPDTFDKYRVKCDMDVSFKALSADPEEGIDNMDETTFYGVKKGTEVTYEINFDEVSCFDGRWFDDNSIKKYFLYPKLKSGDKVISTEIIQVKVYPVRCE